MAVTSDMLEVIPSPNDVSQVLPSSDTLESEMASRGNSDRTLTHPQPGQVNLGNPYAPQPELSPDDRVIIEHRDPALGQPVGKGVIGSQPILLAKLSLNQEIELVCKAYKVGPHSCSTLTSRHIAGYICL